MENRTPRRPRRAAASRPLSVAYFLAIWIPSRKSLWTIVNQSSLTTPAYSKDQNLRFAHEMRSRRISLKANLETVSQSDAAAGLSLAAELAEPREGRPASPFPAVLTTSRRRWLLVELL